MSEVRVATVQATALSAGKRRQSRLWLPGILVLGFTLFIYCPSLIAADAPGPKEVLLLYGFSDQRMNNNLEPLKATVRGHVQGSVNFQVEFLESQRFEDPDYEQSLSDALTHSYGSKRLDVVVVDTFPALRFALAHRKEIFPGIPIVFMEVYPGRIQGQKLPPDVTGVTVTVDVRGSLELAFRLHPDTKNVALVDGTTEFERYWLRVFHEEFLPFQDKANLIDLVGIPPDQIMTQVSQLPPHRLLHANDASILSPAGYRCL
jgi:hypothetical protein